jgi:CheY-like chemotaxis protein
MSGMMQWWHGKPAPAGSKRLRVVVAEDDADLRAMIVTALRGLGYDPVEAQTGAELLEHLSDALLTGDASRGPDLVISDVRMPGLTGLGILTGLRQANWSRPFILMTAYADPGLREDAERLGAAFFAKPFEIDDLVTLVVNLTPAPHGDARRGGAVSH